MKADGKVLKSELDFVKRFLVNQFGENAAVQYLQHLKGFLEKDVPVVQVCHQIRDAMPHSERLQLMHYLWGIAMSDGHLDASELNLLIQIGNNLRISQADFDSIRAMYVKNTESAYKILEIDRSASVEEIKKAYRKMAVKYHPDKVTHLGEEIKKSAEEKFKTLNEAYDSIKKERGMV
jgi:DnaJ like chaperone protein